jgi:hypothetical protein
MTSGPTELPQIRRNAHWLEPVRLAGLSFRLVQAGLVAQVSEQVVGVNLARVGEVG